jgi:hypothetical protein
MSGPPVHYCPECDCYPCVCGRDGHAPYLDEEDEYPLVPCPHCHDYPCRCLMDDDPSDPMVGEWEDRQDDDDGGDL